MYNDSVDKYLYITSHFFLIPVFLSIYSNRNDILFLSLTISITSLLRWKYRANIYFQYLDHNWVKFIFIYMIITIFYLIFYEKYCFFTTYFLFSVIMSIGFIFTLNQVIKFFNYNITIPMHMLVHFYTIFAMFITLFIDHNFLKTFTHIKELLSDLYKKIQIITVL